MTRIHHQAATPKLILLALIMTLLIACGGGGGGDSSIADTSNIMSQEEFEQNKEISLAAAILIEDLLSSRELKDAIAETIDFLMQQNGVEIAGEGISGDSIYINFDSGLKVVIDTTDYDGEIQSFYKNTQSFYKDQIYNAILKTNEKAANSFIIIEPEASSMSYDGPKILSNLLKEKFGDESVTHIKDSDVTPMTFIDLSKYDIIYFNGHGNFSTTYNICTGEKYTWDKVVKYNSDGYDPMNTMTLHYNSKKAKKNKDGGQFGINPNFIKKFTSDLSATVTYMDSCQSLYDDSMARVWIDKGTKTYVGWTNIVSSFFPGMENVCESFFNDLISGKSISESYVNIPLDWNFSDLIFYGNGNVVLDYYNINDSVITKVASGGYHTVVLKGDGTIWAWGSNSFGQVGNGTDTNQYFPVQVGTDHDWADIAPGGRHTLALKHDGTLWAWGYNSLGTLGDGTYANRYQPVQIGTDSDWAAISSGFYHCLALKQDGTLWAWGANRSGQIGNGTEGHHGNMNTPTRIGYDTDWVTISAHWQSLAIKADGTLWAWGSNEYGQLGDGTTYNRNIPTQIGSNKDWLIIEAGGTHTIGIKTDGTLWAWGSNENGQLGDGTLNKSYHPAQIGNDTTWQKVTAGYYFNEAIKADGTLWAWGSNEYGQLGDGTNTDRHTPTQISQLTNCSDVYVGSKHSISLKNDNTVWTWGYNWSGALGNGTNINKNSPIQIF